MREQLDQLIGALDQLRGLRVGRQSQRPIRARPLVRHVAKICYLNGRILLTEIRGHFSENMEYLGTSTVPFE